MLNLLLLCVGVTALLWVCWSAGFLVSASLRLEGPFWFQLGLGQAALGTLWTWLILAGAFRPMIVAIVLILSGLVGSGAALASRRRHPLYASTSGAPVSESHLAERSTGAFERAIFALAFGLLVLVACYPYQGSDFLSYQLPMAQGYAEQGRWIWFDHLRFPTFPPLMNGWFAVALMFGGPSQIQLAQLSALLPLLLLCTLLVRLTHDAEPHARGAWAVALFLGSPAVCWAGMHAYVDGAMTLFMIMAAWCVLRFAQTSGLSAHSGSTPEVEGNAEPDVVLDRRSLPLPWLIAAGALVGAAMNTKHLGVVFVPLLAFWLLSWWMALPRSHRRATHLLRVWGAFGGSAFAVAAPWYIVVWIRVGNPVFPFVESIFGRNPWGWYLSPLTQIQSRPASLLATPLAWDGLSPWLLPTTVLATWFWLRRRPQIASARGLLLFVALGYLFFWSLIPDDRRYLLPSLALLSAAGAPVITSLANRISPLVRTQSGRAFVTAGLIALGLAFLGDQILDQGRLPPAPSDSTYVAEQVPGLASLRWAEDHLAPKRVWVPELEGVRSFSRTATVVGDWAGPWSPRRLLADLHTPHDLVSRLVQNEIDAVILAQCEESLLHLKSRIDRWIRAGYLAPRQHFGVSASTRPFPIPEEVDSEAEPPEGLTRQAAEDLFQQALEVVHRDDEVCVLVPRLK